jgi:IAA-amino acid hydrolase
MIYVYSVQVVSVTYVKAGKALDATPNLVEFGGTLRSLTTEGLYCLQRRVKEVSKIMCYVI